MDEDIVEGALDRGLLALRSTQKRIENINLESASHGRGRSSRHVLALKQAIMDGFSEACLAAAKYAAAAAQDHYTEKAQSLDEAIRRLTLKFVDLASAILEPGTGPFAIHYVEIAGDWRHELELEKDKTVRDFAKFGIVGGERPMPNKTVSISAGSQSQVMVGSPGAKQHSQGNQITEDNRALALFRSELDSLQERVRHSGLPEEAELALLDHLEPLQNEAAKDTPDKGKLARFWGYLGRKADEHGWDLAKNVTQVAALAALGLSV